jgi:exodeoxyribonuclease V alpha subunit
MTTVSELDVELRDALDAARAIGVLGPLEVEFAELFARRANVTDPALALALALAAKAVRLDHVCVELDDEGLDLLWRDDDGEPVELAAPAASHLRDVLTAADGLVEVTSEGADVDEHGPAPVVLSGTRCYLRRYAILEQRVVAKLRATPAPSDTEGVDRALATVADRLDATQALAVRRALESEVSVIAGGPGTGKTTAIAALLDAARALSPPMRVALAAPTGKAAARLDEAVRSAHAEPADDVGSRARTIHALLGIGRDGVARRRARLDCDLLVVDEASMVSLPLLSMVLDAVRPGAGVVLVGDPDQLASIEVGAVLSDVVDAATQRDGVVVVTTLDTSHRFAEGAGVAALADAVRTGSVAAVDAAVEEHSELEAVRPGRGRDAVVRRVADHAESVVAAARSGDGTLALGLVAELGVLCGTRRGDGSTEWWRTTIEDQLVRRGVLRRRDRDYVGRPLMVTRNDPLTGLTNGMTGVVVARGDERFAAFEVGEFPLASVPWTETAWALTIHKSQGSEYGEVVVSLPRAESRVLTRELVYTAVTRARHAVTLVAPTGSLQGALSRRVARSSGLVARLRAAPTS